PLLRYLPSFPTRRSSDLLSGSDQRPSEGVLRHGVGSRLRRGPVSQLFARCTLPEEPPNPNQSHSTLPVQVLENEQCAATAAYAPDRKSTRLNSSHVSISY